MAVYEEREARTVTVTPSDFYAESIELKLTTGKMGNILTLTREEAVLIVQKLYNYLFELQVKESENV